MKKAFFLSLLMLFQFFHLSFDVKRPEWGFHAHQIINRMAVFTLPPEMMIFFKKHIAFISKHSTDPDKRRYAVDGEAIKHYIDLDEWGSFPFKNLSSEYSKVLSFKCEISLIDTSGNRAIIKSASDNETIRDSILIDSLWLSTRLFSNFIKQNIIYKPYHKPWYFSTDSINKKLGISLNAKKYPQTEINEAFSQHGICPYHIHLQYLRLISAFKRQDHKSILRIATDMGHYVADAHVPLHTTKNYNGQLTDQHGIHAFWESRLPEIFADASYEYLVGKAYYIKDVEKFIWQTVLKSHALLEKVLKTESQLDQSLRDDMKFTYETRLGRNIRVQSQEYSRSYHNALDGMVEQRMQDAILALGSIWFTAWIDAGQPLLGKDLNLQWTKEDVRQMELLEINYDQGKAQGRDCK